MVTRHLIKYNLAKYENTRCSIGEYRLYSLYAPFSLSLRLSLSFSSPLPHLFLVFHLLIPSDCSVLTVLQDGKVESRCSLPFFPCHLCMGACMCVCMRVYG